MIETRPGGVRLTVVKITTDQDGFYGYGCATFTQRADLVRSAVEKYLKPVLLGRTTDRIEDIWQMSYNSSYWRNGPVLNNAISGIDQALWDIKGRQTGMPVYQLSGDKCREAARVYRHAQGVEPSAIIEECQKLVSNGTRFIHVSASGQGQPDRNFERIDACCRDEEPVFSCSPPFTSFSLRGQRNGRWRSQQLQHRFEGRPDPAGNFVHQWRWTLLPHGGPQRQAAAGCELHSGSIAVLPILADGRTGEAIVTKHNGSGPSPRQKGPHPHQVLEISGGVILVPDLGADRIARYRFNDADGGLSPADPSEIRLPAGTGPRHLAPSADSKVLYLVSELASTVTR
ncbi:MAG TPA: beta-propeller fold lactonase family protein [Bryobacteraceae bacterium]|nr:beta-propeller fold lactonase family protein [Bryobacteraceae bacterium]